MYEEARQYRIMLHNEVTRAMEIIPWDTAFKTQLYKSICSISHALPLDVAAKIREEIFEELNKKLKHIGG